MSPEEENEKGIGGDYLKCAACGKKDQTISLNDVGPEPSFPACLGNADQVEKSRFRLIGIFLPWPCAQVWTFGHDLNSRDYKQCDDEVDN